MPDPYDQAPSEPVDVVQVPEPPAPGTDVPPPGSEQAQTPPPAMQVIGYDAQGQPVYGAPQSPSRPLPLYVRYGLVAAAGALAWYAFSTLFKKKGKRAPPTDGE